MDKKSAKQRIEKLKKEIERHRYLYHVLDRQEISDAALDSLKKELFDLEQEFPEFITEDSPTQRVGGKPLKKFRKVSHETPMLSFNDAFSKEDMEDWAERVENYTGYKLINNRELADGGLFYCELKIDGLAIELIYESGILVRGATRGDGAVGEDVTQNLKTIEAIPLNLGNRVMDLGFSLPKKLIVRGEVFLTKKEFARINRERERKGYKSYANPRNIAAGSIRQLNPQITAGRKLDSFQYDIALPSEVLAKNDIRFHNQEHECLKKLGFKTNPHNKSAASLEEVFKFHEYWAKHRDKLPYEVDGIVVIVNSNKQFDDSGVIGKAPRAAIAFKFSAKETTTTVKEIKIQVGRTGNLTPIAVLEPVRVGGVTISHATLHNADEIKRLDIRVGDTVIVSRAGDVIPKITKVLHNLRPKNAKKFKMPKYCPADGSKTVRDGVAYKCSNKSCGARNRENLYHFVSRPAFNLEGLGPKIIDRFLDGGLISDASDIFSLEEGDIAALERFGEKSAKNIIKELKEKKEIGLSRFIYSLGIIHVGEETSRLLARMIYGYKFSVTDPEEVLRIFERLTIEDLKSVADIGPVVAKSIADYFKDERHKSLLKKLKQAGIKIKPEKLHKRDKLQGKIFILTGSLKSLSRSAAKEKIRGLGGEASEAVSKNTSYVVVGSDPGSKLDKAKRLGVKVLDEKEFLALLE